MAFRELALLLRYSREHIAAVARAGVGMVNPQAYRQRAPVQVLRGREYSESTSTFALIGASDACSCRHCPAELRARVGTPAIPAKAHSALDLHARSPAAI
jgi:hypothetical protein